MMSHLSSSMDERINKTVGSGAFSLTPKDLLPKFFELFFPTSLDEDIK